MKIGNTEIEVDFSQASTKRGVVWVVGGLIATILILKGDQTGATAIMTIAGTVAGGMGVAIKD